MSYGGTTHNELGWSPPNVALAPRRLEQLFLPVCDVVEEDGRAPEQNDGQGPGVAGPGWLVTHHVVGSEGVQRLGKEKWLLHWF